MYDSRIGRWTSIDPARQFASPYVGMGNNPIGLIDPDGRKWVKGANFWHNMGDALGLGHWEKGHMAYQYVSNNVFQGIGRGLRNTYNGIKNNISGLSNELGVRLSMTGLAFAESEAFANTITSSRSGFSSGQYQLPFKWNTYIMSKTTASRFATSFKYGGLGLSAYGFYVTHENYENGNISYNRMKHEQYLNSVGTLSGLVFPVVPIGIAAGDYLGVRHAEEIENEITNGHVHQAMKWVLESLGIPTEKPSE